MEADYKGYYNDYKRTVSMADELLCALSEINGNLQRSACELTENDREQCVNLPKVIISTMYDAEIVVEKALEKCKDLLRLITIELVNENELIMSADDVIALNKVATKILGSNNVFTKEVNDIYDKIISRQ